jgi:ubiquinone/menaquinone biosynthesis C-methylase UbiE
MASKQAENVAKQSYDSFAAVYDDFNHEYKYERWTGRLLEKAEAAGLAGNRLLDVACGTGLSFVPLLEHGWQVTGCDISPAMLEVARARVGDGVTLVTADMRRLPALGRFDLIWSLNDSLNYLLTTADFEATLAGMARNLGPGGLVVFDVNTVTTYRTFFSSSRSVEVNGRKLHWRGLMSAAEIFPASINEAHFEGDDADLTHVHRQRHFPEGEVLAAAESAGLRLLDLYGESDGDLSRGLDEETHTKAVYVFAAARPC